MGRYTPGRGGWALLALPTIQGFQEEKALGHGITEPKGGFQAFATRVEGVGEPMLRSIA